MTQLPPRHPALVRRLLAIDPGQRRTGVAVSDDLGMYAHPRPALTADSTEALIEAVEAVVQSEQIAEVVVGLPLSLSGGDSAQTAAVRRLIAGLRAALRVPVTEWDERLSTVQAARAVRGASRRRSGELDSAAAALVLQSVLDSRRGSV